MKNFLHHVIYFQLLHKFAYLCVYNVLGFREFMYKHAHSTLKISKCPSLSIIGVAL